MRFKKLHKKTKILLYGANVWYFGEGMFGPLFAVFTERIGGDILDITWAWATYMIVTGLMYIVIGGLTDRKFNKARVMMLGYALNAVFTFAYLLVSSPAELFAVQIGLGIAAALATPTWDALYSKYQNRRQSGLTWGLAGGQAQVITGIATILGGLIVTYVSFNALFIIMGSIQVMATVYQSRILKR